MGGYVECGRRTYVFETGQLLGLLSVCTAIPVPSPSEQTSTPHGLTASFDFPFARQPGFFECLE